MAIRVALVDDHTVVTDGLRTLLSEFDDIEVVGSARDGAAAVELCASHSPDVVLMDLSMPGMDGVEATQHVIADKPDLCVIALTAFLDERLVRDVLAAGASGYLMKSASGADLVDAIRSAANGRASLSLEVLRHVRRGVDSGEDHHLTPRELDVLQRLASGASNKTIARSLSLSPGTVRVHVSSILAKLGVENRTAAALYALRHNLVTDPPD
ncbi:MAG: response regulator transcription factor [Acidimicrobiia bacterium]|nr:response regulator transcription factor [Acidimicrobiia bacterium]